MATVNPEFPLQDTDPITLQMTVLAEGGQNPQRPLPGTLFDADGNVLGRLAQGKTADAVNMDATGCWVRLDAGARSGWCHLSGLIPSIGRHVPWLEIAQREIGVSEADDAGTHRIRDYLASVEVPPALGKNWCACFINWCMREAGKDPLNTPRARNWANWKSGRNGPGRVPKDARPGDLAVGKRHAPEDGEPGHVAILLAYQQATHPLQDRLLLLGGNQSRNPLDADLHTRVRYSWYPRETPLPPSKLVAVRFDPETDAPG